MRGGSDERRLGDLARSAASGDRAAFRRLYRASVEQVHGQVGRMIGWGPEVEDVVQQVFLEVFKALPGFRGEAGFKTWLFRLTHNVAVTYLRRRRNRPVELARIQDLSVAVHQPDLDARRQLTALYAALDQVSTEAREAFVLYEIEGRSLRAIAAITQTPANTVASRVRRTRERLRRLLERERETRRKAR